VAPVPAWDLPQKEQPLALAAALNWPLAQDLHEPALDPPQPEWKEPAAQV
jgi:hypothetical protein